MNRVKYLVFGLRNIVFRDEDGRGFVDNPLFSEFSRLLRFVHCQGITPVVFANDNWAVGGKEVQPILTEYWGNIPI